LVVSTEGRTGFAQLCSGSVAESVVRHARLPVLVVR
jgi:nucleotide-binding universal stress UspA family protein